jgi:hypothetical protein
MDKKKLNDLDQQVTDGKQILKKIEKLKEVAKSCRSEVGFMEIRTMYQNDGDLSLKEILGSTSIVHETFRVALGSAAEAKIQELEQAFTTLEIK